MFKRSNWRAWLALAFASCGLSLAVAASSALAWSASEGGFSASGFNPHAGNEDGTEATQAGSHPYEGAVEFTFHGGDVKDIEVLLPPGFLGNPQALPACPLSELTDVGSEGKGSICPADTRVGEVSVIPNGATKSGTLSEAYVYNLAPEPGYPSEFGFNFFGNHPTILYGTVRTGGDYGITVVTPGIVQGTEVGTVKFKFWGVPAAHNGSQSPPQAFLTLPVNCAGGTAANKTGLRVDSWQYFGEYKLYEATPPGVTGCSRLSFTPTLAVTPDTTQVDQPTGLTIDMKLPWSNDPARLATPELRNTVLTFPQGLAISPTAADGLEGCTDAQFAKDANVPAACPNASQVATVEIVSPLLATPLPGQVYLGSPLCSPCSSADASSGKVFRLFLQAQTSGALVKLEGTVSPNPITGQLTARFSNTPQLPFTDLRIHVKAGSRAAFVNPPTCGSQTTTSDLTPWSSPYTPDSDPSSTYETSWDGAGAACPAGGEPFDPSFTMGALVPLAGGFSPFTLTFERPSGDQPLSGFKLELPPGLLGKISSVPLCPEPQAAQGTCPESSLIGTTTVGAGSGSHPFFLGGKIYLTGPYKGAPFGVTVEVPAVAGPYNLGTVVVRAAIDVDPHDAHVIATVDPLPQILSGVPTRLRIVNVTLGRPGFMFNPTSCTPKIIHATIGAASGLGVQVTSPFDVAGCQNLPFKPAFKVSTSGHTSRANGASLDAKVIYPVSSTATFASLNANIARVKVDLPKQLPSRLTTLQKACTVATFEANPAACPPASVVGIARASTPLLAHELTGPAIFVSYGGAQFPELVIVLQGEGVRVDLHGETFISKAGITSSTFKSVPDVPIASFEIYLPQGKYSALAANGNLCTSNLLMPTEFRGQNGAVIHKNTKITATGCPKTKNKKAKTAVRRTRVHNDHASHGGR